jgi:RNA polymerase sigma-70 factor (sigma-E family)
MDGGFEAYVAARGDALHRTAYLLTHDHGLAEDLVQTALAKAWGAWRRIEGDPDPYVKRVMVNTFASWWRRRWNGEHPTEELPEVGSPDHGDAVATRTGLVDALTLLPRRMRAVVVLRYFEDLTEAQTADVLGISIGTVKSQTAKALAHLRVAPALAAPSLTEEKS